MPNWVYNTCSVRGNKDDIANFRAKYFSKKEDGGLEFDFDKVIPEPRKENECPKDCLTKGNDHIEIFGDRPWFNWYGWRCKYWGVKWNASDTYIEAESDDEILFDFNTPWDVPRPILNELKKQNPKLKFLFDALGEEEW